MEVKEEITEFVQMEMANFQNAIISDSERGLPLISNPDKNIAIYKRSVDQFKSIVNQIIKKGLQLRIEGSVDEIKQQLTNSLSDLELNDEAFISDITMLIDKFQSISKATSFKVFLSAVKSNMCSKFHTDINTLRMLCSYEGPGTLWLPDEVVNGVNDPSNENWEENHTDKIQQASTGNVVLLKGALYPNGNAVMHKSPAIEGTEQNRLLLRIDTNNFLTL